MIYCDFSSELFKNTPQPIMLNPPWKNKKTDKIYSFWLKILLNVAGCWEDRWEMSFMVPDIQWRSTDITGVKLNDYDKKNSMTQWQWMPVFLISWEMPHKFIFFRISHLFVQNTISIDRNKQHFCFYFSLFIFAK